MASAHRRAKHFCSTFNCDNRLLANRLSEREEHYTSDTERYKHSTSDAEKYEHTTSDTQRDEHSTSDTEGDEHSTSDTEGYAPGIHILKIA